MKFIGCLNKSVTLTYIGMIFTLVGIFNLSLNGYLDISIIYFILAGICDLFDGVIARKCKRNELQKKFGIQLDSLVDVISFVVYPVILLYYIWDTTSFLFILVSVFYMICGITRLAWFNINSDDYKDSYQGLPVTYSALIIPILYAIFKRTSLMKIIFPIIYCFMGLLFILNVRMKKPRGIWYIIFGILAVVTIGIIIIW